AEDGIRDFHVTGVQTCALPILAGPAGDGPDIIVGAHDWLGELIVNGLIEPIDLGDLAGDFEQVTLDAFTWGDQLYGVPIAFESIGLKIGRASCRERVSMQGGGVAFVYTSLRQA